jgi:ComF family protein
MASFLTKATDGLLHLFFPHTCTGCGSDVLGNDQLLCLHCLSQLPETGFHALPGNPVEKIFYGRLPVEAAAALFFFSKDSLPQHLLHQVKYKGNQKLGVFLGRLLGHRLAAGAYFKPPDAIVPIPLSAARQRKRGYNQAAVIANGMAEVLNVPVITQAITRTRATETQTHKNREERWQNMQEVFELTRPAVLQNKRLLLVDDVVTTGATLEACGAALLRAPGVQLQVAALACTL